MKIITNEGKNNKITQNLAIFAIIFAIVGIGAFIAVKLSNNEGKTDPAISQAEEKGDIKEISDKSQEQEAHDLDIFEKAREIDDVLWGYKKDSPHILDGGELTSNDADNQPEPLKDKDGNTVNFYGDGSVPENFPLEKDFDNLPISNSISVPIEPVKIESTLNESDFSSLKYAKGSITESNIQNVEKTFGIDFSDVNSTKKFNEKSIDEINTKTGTMVNEQYLSDVVKSTLAKINNVINTGAMDENNEYRDAFKAVILSGEVGNSQIPEFDDKGIELGSWRSIITNSIMFNESIDTSKVESLGAYAGIMSEALFEKFDKDIKIFMITPTYEAETLFGNTTCFSSFATMEEKLYTADFAIDKNGDVKLYDLMKSPD